ncbi:hypothetical protein B0H16DRAFT_1486515, partial [Mycena metata]
GVRLPAMDKKDPWISLPLVQEFNYVFTWEFVRVGGTKAFQALKLEGLRVLRVKGTEGTDKGHGWGTPKQEDAAKQVHKALTKFLGRSPQLKILQIAFDIPFEGQTLLEELRRCQNLEELDVPICHPDLWTRELFGGLQDLEVCPKLRVMRLPQLGWGSDLWEDYEGDNRETETRRDVGLDEMLGARFGAGLRTFDLRPRGSMRDGYDEWGNEQCSDAERWSDGPERWAEAVKWDWLGGAPLAGWVLPDDVWTRLLSLRAATGWDILLDERPPPLVCGNVDLGADSNRWSGRDYVHTLGRVERYEQQSVKVPYTTAEIGGETRIFNICSRNQRGGKEKLGSTKAREQEIVTVKGYPGSHQDGGRQGGRIFHRMSRGVAGAKTRGGHAGTACQNRALSRGRQNKNTIGGGGVLRKNRRSAGWGMREYGRWVVRAAAAAVRERVSRSAGRGVREYGGWVMRAAAAAVRERGSRSAGRGVRGYGRWVVRAAAAAVRERVSRSAGRGVREYGRWVVRAAAAAVRDRVSQGIT